jgi:hypothetical protein
MRQLLLLFFIFSYTTAIAIENKKFQNLTFRKMLIEEKSKHLSDCVKSLKNFYSDGKKIESNILENNILNIEDHNFPIDSEGGSVFFHYTYAKEVKRSAKRNAPMRIFKYLRRNGIHSQPELYIAADPNTSSSYGNIQMRVYLKRKSKLLDHSFSKLGFQDTVELIAKSIIQENPELKSCGGNGPRDDLKVYYLGLEDHEVSIIKYNSIHDNYWFQLFDPYSVSRIELGNN